MQPILHSPEKFLLGDPFVIPGSIKNDDGTACDLTGVSLVWTLTDQYGVIQVSLSLQTGIPIAGQPGIWVVGSPVNGVVQIQVSAAQCGSLIAGNFADVLKGLIGGVPVTYCYGKLCINDPSASPIPVPINTLPGIILEKQTDITLIVGETWLLSFPVKTPTGGFYPQLAEATYTFTVVDESEGIRVFQISQADIVATLAPYEDKSVVVATVPVSYQTSLPYLPAGQYNYEFETVSASPASVSQIHAWGRIQLCESLAIQFPPTVFLTAVNVVTGSPIIGTPALTQFSR